MKCKWSMKSCQVKNCIVLGEYCHWYLVAFVILSVLAAKYIELVLNSHILRIWISPFTSSLLIIPKSPPNPHFDRNGCIHDVASHLQRTSHLVLALPVLVASSHKNHSQTLAHKLPLTKAQPPFTRFRITLLIYPRQKSTCEFLSYLRKVLPESFSFLACGGGIEHLFYER